MNIYVGNLNYRVRDFELQRLLEEFGVVNSIKIITDRETGRARGFAFAEMPNANEAQQAIRSLNETEFMGRSLVMREARPRM